MSDLRSQLIAKLGASPPAEAPAAPSAAPDPLHADAHLDTPWLALLRAARAPGLAAVPPKPSLNAAKQLTDKAVKALKGAGAAREARALDDARQDYLKRREKLAWAELKRQFTACDLPERSYRALKQAEVDPEKALAKLRRQDPAALKAMGADRLRDALLG